MKNLNFFDWFLILGIIITNLIYSIIDINVNNAPFDYIGFIAGITGVLCVVLVAKGMIINYLFGLINVSLYAYISYRSQLYGDFVLNLFYYVPMQFIGWYAWNKRKRADTVVETVKTRRMNLKQRIILFLTCAVSVIITGYILDKFTADLYPYKDALTTVLSIIAMYIMVKAYSEQWILWIITNCVGIVIWFQFFLQGTQSAGLMIIFWAFYLINSIYGYWMWNKKLA